MIRRPPLLASLLTCLAAVAAGQDPTLFRHPDGYFEIEQPPGWEARTTYNGMEWQVVLRAPETTPDDPETALRVLFVPLAPDANRRALREQVADLTRQVAGDLVEPTGGEIAGEARIEVSGRPAHEVDVRQVNDSGVAIRGRVVGTVGDEAILFLIFYAPATTWNRHEPTFARMVDSLGHWPARVAEAAPSARTTTYVDPEGVFEIERPINWIPQVTREQDGLRYHFVPKRSIQLGREARVLVFVQHFPLPSTNATLAETVRDLRDRMLAGDAALEVVVESEVRIDGVPALRIEYRRKAEGGGEAIREDVTYLRKGPRVFIVMAAAPMGLHPTHREAFEKMTASLHVR